MVISAVKWVNTWRISVSSFWLLAARWGLPANPDSQTRPSHKRKPQHSAKQTFFRPPAKQKRAIFIAQDIQRSGANGLGFLSGRKGRLAG